MVYRYHFTKGPVGPADMPKGATSVFRHDKPMYNPFFQRKTWGYCEYDHPIQPVDLEKFGLLSEPRNHLPGIMKG